MGISCICAIDVGAGLPRVFCGSNLMEFAEWTRGALLVGFNNVGFDDELLRANGLYTAAASWDLLRELRAKVGETPGYTPGLTAPGRTLSDLARVNLKLKKIDTADAPMLAQRGRIGELVDRCLRDTTITYKLFQRREALVDPVFGVVVILDEPTLPAIEKEASPASMLDVYLPRWTESPLAGTRLREIPTFELEAIGVQQRDRGGSRALSLVGAIADELERRKQEPA
jgi:hypothetical protein